MLCTRNGFILSGYYWVCAYVKINKNIIANHSSIFKSKIYYYAHISKNYSKYIDFLCFL